MVSEEQNYNSSHSFSVDPAHTDKQKAKKNSCSDELMIGIAEGGARTHDLEVDLFAVIRATRSTN